mgnify:CR=1 FL=1
MVTGAFGWLGHKLVQRLISEKREIICLDFSKKNMKNTSKTLSGYKKLRIILGDIRESHKLVRELKGCDTVFNCAGLQHTKYTKDIYEVNRDGTAELLKASIKEVFLSIT